MGVAPASLAPVPALEIELADDDVSDFGGVEALDAGLSTSSQCSSTFSSHCHRHRSLMAASSSSRGFFSSSISSSSDEAL